MSISNGCRVCLASTIFALLALGVALLTGCQSPITNTVTFASPGTNPAVTMPHCPPASTNCPPPHCVPGTNPSPDVLTRGNLLTLLTLLVALAAYLANIRRDLGQKIEETQQQRQKEKDEKKKNTDPAKIDEYQRKIEKCKDREKRIRAERCAITLADVLVIFAVVFIGLHVFWNEFSSHPAPGWIRPTGMIFTIVAMAYLIFLHAIQWRKLIKTILSR